MKNTPEILCRLPAKSGKIFVIFFSPHSLSVYVHIFLLGTHFYWQT
uniref:Uncharacterized protein n=1 Tax=Anguilla anguilla TaxID=7936 RepID=A0A0E9SCB8_ANGAN